MKLPPQIKTFTLSKQQDSQISTESGCKKSIGLQIKIWLSPGIELLIWNHTERVKE